MKKLLTVWILLFAIALHLTGCGTAPAESLAPAISQETPDTVGAELDLLSAMIRQNVTEASPDQKVSVSMTDFAISLLQNSYVAGETTVLSPYSVYLALGMTANGARGETLSQIEALLGMSAEEWNSYARYLQNDEGQELNTANSVWFRDDISVQQSFLQALKDYYEAQVYSRPFDADALEAMNNWIREETDGRILQTLDQMNPNAQMYLINALTFSGSWAEAYTSQNIFEGVFHGTEGDKTVTMMSSEEGRYLDDGMATGFMKDYEGGRYSFVALLPKEGLSLDSYLSSLTGEDLLRMIREAEHTTVNATMPKVQSETAVELRDVLSAMGMVDAFTMEADLSGINGQGDLFISRILHKTYLQVDEAGTQAGAVTMEEVITKGVLLNRKEVFLDRPYFMGIYDNVHQCFLFMGAVENP